MSAPGDPRRETLIAIYDAAVDADGWERVADEMTRVVGSRGCWFFVSEASEERPWQLGAGSRMWRNLPEGVVDRYVRTLAHYEKPAFDKLMRLPRRTLITTEQPETMLDPTREREDSRYLIEHFGCFHRAAFRLNDDPGWFDSITLQYDAALERIPPEGLERSRNYLAHIGKALETGRAYRLLRLRHAAVLAALDHVRVGMVVALAGGDAIVANASAERLIGEADGLHRDVQGRLRLHDEAADGRLRRAIGMLAGTAAGTGRTSAVTLFAPRRGDAQPLLLEVTPLRDALGEIGPDIVGVMIAVVDPGDGTAVDIHRLAAHVGLSDAERAVCEHLVRGHASARIAEERDIGPDAVDARIASAFRKCGVASRTELVRLALRTSPPVDASVDPPRSDG